MIYYQYIINITIYIIYIIHFTSLFGWGNSDVRIIRTLYEYHLFLTSRIRTSILFIS